MATEPDESRVQTAEDTYRLLRAAVLQRRPVSCTYDGLRRLLCPHVLGTNRAGQKRVFCYQYGGGSSSGLQPRAGSGSWRCLAVDKLDEVELTEGDWHTEAHARQRCVDQVEVSADQPDELQKGQ